MLKTLKNLLSLTVRVEDFNLVAKKPDLLRRLRDLTLHVNSGMNHEMNHMLKVIHTRPVQCKIIMAFCDRQMVGWALLSREKSGATPLCVCPHDIGSNSFYEKFDHFNYNKL